MQALQVPTRQVVVEIVTVAGEQYDGSLFLAENPYHEGDAHDLEAALNDEREFIPFASADPAAGGSLLNKMHILRVHVRPMEGDDALPGDDESHPECTLILEDGTRITGRLAVESRIQSSRLVDKLNVSHRFMPLVTDAGIDFVQAQHVVRAY